MHTQVRGEIDVGQEAIKPVELELMTFSFIQFCVIGKYVENQTGLGDNVWGIDQFGPSLSLSLHNGPNIPKMETKDLKKKFFFFRGFHLLIFLETNNKKKSHECDENKQSGVTVEWPFQTALHIRWLSTQFWFLQWTALVGVPRLSKFKIYSGRMIGQYAEIWR